MNQYPEAGISVADNLKDNFLENINISVTIKPVIGTNYKTNDIMTGLMGSLKFLD